MVFLAGFELLRLSLFLWLWLLLAWLADCDVEGVRVQAHPREALRQPARRYAAAYEPAPWGKALRQLPDAARLISQRPWPTICSVRGRRRASIIDKAA